MSWRKRLHLPETTPALQEAQAARLQQWLARPATPAPGPGETRYVVLNVAASTPDPEQAEILAVAAIAINGNRIHPADSLLSDLSEDATEALLDLFEFTGTAPLVAFNAPFHRTLLDISSQARLGCTLQQPWLDLYWLLPALFPERHDRPVPLASWAAAFALDLPDRRSALGDAWLVAQLLLPALAAAPAHGALDAAGLLALAQQLRFQLRAP